MRPTLPMLGLHGIERRHYPQPTSAHVPQREFGAPPAGFAQMPTRFGTRIVACYHAVLDAGSARQEDVELDLFSKPKT